MADSTRVMARRNSFYMFLHQNSDTQKIENNKKMMAELHGLRNYLENVLGERRYREAYKFLKKIKAHQGNDDESLLSDIEYILGGDGLPYLETMLQLITMEEGVLA